VSHNKECNSSFILEAIHNNYKDFFSFITGEYTARNVKTDLNIINYIYIYFLRFILSIFYPWR